METKLMAAPRWPWRDELDAMIAAVSSHRKWQAVKLGWGSGAKARVFQAPERRG